MEVGQTAERDSLAARTRDGTREGFIIPIGGAEEKIGDTRILSRFVHLCGGEDARIAIIPTASELDDTGSRYEEVFHRIGVKSARALPFKVSAMRRRGTQAPDRARAKHLNRDISTSPSQE